MCNTYTHLQKQQAHHRLRLILKGLKTEYNKSNNAKAFVQFAETGENDPDEFDRYALAPAKGDVDKVKTYVGLLHKQLAKNHRQPALHYDVNAVRV